MVYFFVPQQVPVTGSGQRFGKNFLKNGRRRSSFVVDAGLALCSVLRAEKRATAARSIAAVTTVVTTNPRSARRKVPLHKIGAAWPQR